MDGYRPKDGGYRQLVPAVQFPLLSLPPAGAQGAVRSSGKPFSADPMHPFFKIQPEMVQRLDDTAARQLIARLCEADIARSGLPPCVFYGGDQRAADDGVDVEVACRPLKRLSEKLSRSVAIVQVKAEKSPFGPKRIKDEMQPKGSLRPSIAALAKDHGLYLIVSTRENPSFRVRAARLGAMRDVLNSSGLSEEVEAEFYGAQEVASWVETHPTVAIWLREVLGQPLSGWKGYGPWAYREADIDRDFILDEQGRVSLPDKTEPGTVAEAIVAIRRDLKSGKAVRLLGLSGLGKTRLAQALFDHRIEAHEPALSPKSAVYADIGDRPSPTPEEMLAAISQSTGETVLVIDNCGQQTHNALVESSIKSSISLGLLTIEYDVRDKLAPSTRAYELDGASDKTLDEILQARYKHLSGPDRDVIVRASSGNARLAMAIAETAPQSGQLSSLEDSELFRRLFYQRAETGDELLRCARAASLLYSFDGEDMEPGSELCALAGLADVSPSTFYRQMAEIKRRGLLQARGKMRAILPHAIGNYLANEGLQEVSSSKVVETLFAKATPRVKSSFGNRLSNLGNSTVASQVVTSWLSRGGALSKISSLRDEEMLTFRRVAPINPSLALAAVERFLDDSQRGKCLPYVTRDLSNLLNAIAYDPNLFDRSVSALQRLANEEQDSERDSNGTRKNLTALFQIIHSGTHAPIPIRAAALRRMLNSHDEQVFKLGLDCLDASLKTLSLSSSGSPRFGARSRDYGWRPQSMADQQLWFAEFLAVAGHFASSQSERGALVRSTIGRRARDLLHLDDQTISSLVQLTPLFQTEDGWPEAWAAAKLLLRRTNIDEELRRRVNMFVHAVAPRGLRQRVVAKVHSRELFDDEEFDVDQYAEREKESQLEAEAVGEELGKDGCLLMEMLPRLMERGSRGQLFSLGQGVATSHEDIPLLIDIIGKTLDETDEQSLSTIFLRGVMSGWSERDPNQVDTFLESCIHSPIWARWYSELQLALVFDDRALARTIEAIEHGIVPVEEFTWPRMGSTLAPGRVSEFGRLIDSLARRGASGIHTALDTLHMQVFSAKELAQSEQAELGAYCLNFLLRFDWTALNIDQAMVEHDLEGVFDYTAKHAIDFASLRDLVDITIKHHRGNSRFDRHSKGRLIGPVLTRFPGQCLTYLASHPLLSQPEDAAEFLLHESPSGDQGLSSHVPDEALLSWVIEDPNQRADFAISICRLAPSSTQEAEVEGAFATARRIYELSTSKAKAIAILGSRLVSSSFSSREIPYMISGIRMLDELPAPTTQKESEARSRIGEELSNRIEWMTDMGKSSGREPEGFE